MLIRSRLVARDFKNKNDERNFDVFAATPPLETKRLLFRMARVKGSVGGNDKDGQVKLMYIDVKKAHLNGEVDDDDFAYITLSRRLVAVWGDYGGGYMGCGPQHLRGKSTTPRTKRTKATSVDVLRRRHSRTRRPASGSWSGATTSRSSGGRGTSRRAKTAEWYDIKIRRDDGA